MVVRIVRACNQSAIRCLRMASVGRRANADPSRSGSHLSAMSVVVTLFEMIPMRA
jgi:hypothetical protein